MAGIYIHIPFCKSKCSYCDFFSATDYNQQIELLEAMKKELFLQKEYLKKELVFFLLLNFFRVCMEIFWHMEHSIYKKIQYQHYFELQGLLHWM